MKIAVASTGKEMNSALDSRFGRASAFVVYDTETEEIQAIDNGMNLNAAQGAGIQTAQNVAATGASAVIGANFGPKAVQVLQAAGIKMYICSAGTVGEALKEFAHGKLEEAKSANVSSHW